MLYIRIYVIDLSWILVLEV